MAGCGWSEERVGRGRGQRKNSKGIFLSYTRIGIDKVVEEWAFSTEEPRLLPTKSAAFLLVLEFLPGLCN